MALHASQALRNLIELGKEHGYLTLDEISRTLSMSNVKSEEVDELMSTLEDLGIEIVDRKKSALTPVVEKERFAEEWSAGSDVPLPPSSTFWQSFPRRTSSPRNT